MSKQRAEKVRFLSRLWQKYIGASTGWNWTAKVNCILLVALTVLLFIPFILIARKSDGVSQVTYFVDGSCGSTGVPLINTFLHLLINIISTLVLGSSNFFMQVLNAPSREELDAAHIRNTWMDVGVYSTRNLFKISLFKRLCWFGLMITSIPLHLFFNSTVFNTEYRSANYSLTIASEEFLNGASYFPPGATLFTYGQGFKNARRPNSPDRNSTLYTGDFALWNSSPYDVAYGDLYEPWDFYSKTSWLAADIGNAAHDGKGWHNLSLPECQKEFGVYGAPCNGLTQYNALIFVTTNTEGWVRGDMWNLTEKEALNLNHHVPANEPNHLFFYTTCHMFSNNTGRSKCFDNCYNALGGRYNQTTGPKTQYWPSGYPFFFGPSLKFVNGTDNTTSSQTVSGLHPDSDTIALQYCLAKPFHEDCHIGASPILLLLGLLCIVGKTTIAILVTIIAGNQEHKPLITLGDSIASFIESPDSRATDCAAISATKSRQLIVLSGPRPWDGIRHLRAKAVPLTVLLASSLLFATAISVCAYLLSGLSGRIFTGSFLASSDNTSLHDIGVNTFFTNVLVANSPQVFLSLCYVAFNNLFTYFCVAMEWEAFSQRALPLRVTDPKGEQISSYRLQLPYRYSLPLMALSASLHWLVANTLYVILTEGGYVSGVEDVNLPYGVTAILGYSSISLFVLIIVTSLTIMVSFVFSLKRSSPDTVIVGTNSFLIALACHVSPKPPTSRAGDHTVADSSSSSTEHEVLERSASTSDRQDETQDESSDLMETATSTETPPGDMESSDLLETATSEQTRLEDVETGTKESKEEVLDERQIIARSKLRWGVLSIPPAQSPQTGQEYEFLGFGTETDGVTAPVKGKWYL